MGGIGQWIGFLVFVLALLALDLGLFHRRAHAVTFREAAIWSAIWVLLSLALCLGIHLRYGPEPALQFLTVYLLEKSLSVDNIFLFALIFADMGVAAEYQHRVLFWGVLGAIVMRGAFIGTGVELIRHFHFVLYVFAALLIVLGLRLFRRQDKRHRPGGSRIVTLARKLFSISESPEGGEFFTRCGGHLCATSLLLVLIMIEMADVTFAIDSIPAAFAVTQDAFIIFTSNVMAVLGLRALYFLLARAISRFRYLHLAVAAIMILIGLRMLTAHWVRIPTVFALAGIVLILGVAVIASLWSECKQ